MTKLTPKEQQVYDAAEVCGTCNKEFSENNRKVRHHCHVTGEYLGATCNNCNLQLKPKKKKSKKRRKHDDEKTETVYDFPPTSEFEANSRKITHYVEKEMKDEYFLPVIAHNMRGYDGHLIIKHMDKTMTCQEIQVIATSTEKFMAFEI